MGLYERLLRQEEPKISWHAFSAAMAERKRGNVTVAEVISTFGLDAAAQADATALNARFDDTLNPLTAAEFHDIGLLADARLAYTTVAALMGRLGVTRAA